MKIPSGTIIRNGIMEIPMTTQQALEILNQATAQLPVNRATHEQILRALETLRAALTSPQSK